MRILAHHTAYDRAHLREALATNLSLGGWFERLRERGNKVLLKPNFVMSAPRDDTSTTHPDFYMALAQVLINQGFKVGIGESPAFGSCTSALQAHGVLEEAHELGISIVEFRRSQTFAGLTDQPFYRELSIAAELRDWDSIINVPKLKTHRQFAFTGATKNLYGCVVGKRKFMRHNACANDPARFAQMIIANATQVNCVLHIADGIEAMHVNGPRGGQPYALGHVLIAENPLLLDWIFCRLISLPAKQTPLFKALDWDAQQQLQHQAEMYDSVIQPVHDFIHAPLIHISLAHGLSHAHAHALCVTNLLAQQARNSPAG